MACFQQDGFMTGWADQEAYPPKQTRSDLTDHILLPGLVNTHHHFYQTLTRAVPAAQNANLFNWLRTLYPIWARLAPADIFTSTQTALAELALSGCTTASDHLYLFPNGSKLDDEIEAAQTLGLRLHASRGSMSLGQSRGGLPPDSVVEDDKTILKDTQRVIEEYHDPNPGSCVQVVVAPCSPFSVTPELMRQSASLAREYGVQLHTHLSETQDEEVFCLEKFGYRPVAYMGVLNWIRRMCGLPIPYMLTGRRLTCSLPAGAVSLTAHPRICAWLPGSPGAPHDGCRSARGLGWMARPATTARICWAKGARRCFSPA
jgi:cytosine/adenosine deaminase-related metal-dependent hydrolase